MCQPKIRFILNPDPTRILSYIVFARSTKRGVDYHEKQCGLINRCVRHCISLLSITQLSSRSKWNVNSFKNAIVVACPSNQKIYFLVFGKEYHSFLEANETRVSERKCQGLQGGFKALTFQTVFWHFFWGRGPGKLFLPIFYLFSCIKKSMFCFQKMVKNPDKRIFRKY